MFWKCKKWRYFLVYYLFFGCPIFGINKNLRKQIFLEWHFYWIDAIESHDKTVYCTVLARREFGIFRNNFYSNQVLQNNNSKKRSLETNGDELIARRVTFTEPGKCFNSFSASFWEAIKTFLFCWLLRRYKQSIQCRVRSRQWISFCFELPPPLFIWVHRVCTWASKCSFIKKQERDCLWLDWICMLLVTNDRPQRPHIDNVWPAFPEHAEKDISPKKYHYFHVVSNPELPVFFATRKWWSDFDLTSPRCFCPT